MFAGHASQRIAGDALEKDNQFRQSSISSTPRSIEDILELPLMTDPASLATMDVLTKIAPAAFTLMEANFHALAVCWAANLSLERGNSDASCDCRRGFLGRGMAQQLAHQYPSLCRRLVLAATSPGAIMVPGTPRAVLKLATPRRYFDKDYMRKSAPEIYGGAFKKDPSLIDRHADAMSGARGLGYL
jgi:hypothetical protein